MKSPTLTTQEYPAVPEGVLRAVNDLSARLEALEAAKDSFTTSVTVEESALPVRVKNQLRGAPVGVLLVAAQDLTAKGQPPVALGSVGWSAAGGQVLISALAGITAGHSYRLTLLVLGS